MKSAFHFSAIIFRAVQKTIKSTKEKEAQQTYNVYRYTQLTAVFFYLEQIQGTMRDI